MHLKSKFLIVVASFYACIGCAQSTDNMYQSYVAHKTIETITIDGKTDEESWAKSNWSNAFIDIEGVKKPTYETQVKMLWDETYFYILANIREPHVWGDIIQHDAVMFHNNDFEVFVDPDGDTHNYYELEINALNTAWDLFITKPYRELNSAVLNDWHITGLKSAVNVNGTLNDASDIDKGWTLEIAIPWTVFKTSYLQDVIPNDEFWRVNFSRVNWEHSITNGKYSRKKDDSGKYLPEYNWVWSPQGVINMHEPEKWGYVYFSSEEVGNSIEFTIPKDEKIKWELYKLYRAQKKHYSVNKKWITSIEVLSTSPIMVDGETLNPTIENHSFGWTITVKSPFSNKLLVIREDGKFKKK
ncbi:MAG: carbohydrate-binding family 9-like protein [Emcibacter sp.]|nr:carbohydrate-binding family 9-like protein [Emcibacter sp.]